MPMGQHHWLTCSGNPGDPGCWLSGKGGPGKDREEPFELSPNPAPTPRLNPVGPSRARPAHGRRGCSPAPFRYLKGDRDIRPCSSSLFTLLGHEQVWVEHTPEIIHGTPAGAGPGVAAPLLTRREPVWDCVGPQAARMSSGLPSPGRRGRGQGTTSSPPPAAGEQEGLAPPRGRVGPAHESWPRLWESLTLAIRMVGPAHENWSRPREWLPRPRELAPPVGSPDPGY